MEDSPKQPITQIDAEQWVDRHGDALYRYALVRLRDPEAAEEVVQETFVAALQAQDQYAGRGEEGAWLLGICKRKVVDYVRQRQRRDAGTGDDLGADPSVVWFDATGNWRHDPRILKNRPDAALERDEFWRVLRACLARLAQRQADVFTLREIEGMAGDEICKDLGISPSNFWVLMHRARLSLMRCIQLHFRSAGD